MEITTEQINATENFPKNPFQFLSLAEGISEEFHAQREAQMNQLKREKLLTECGLPARHSKPFSPTGNEWLATESRINAKIGTGFIIALCGGRGVGKTQLAASCAAQSASRLRSSRYTLAMEFFLDIKASFRPDSGKNEKQVIAEYARPKLLIIDETQERGETKWEDGLLTHLIDRRYQDEKDTLLISNQTPQAFTESIGASIASRIQETGGIIVCNWPSYRSN